MTSADSTAYLRNGPELAGALDRLGIFGEDRTELLATLPRTPRLYQLVDGTAQSILDTLGRRAMVPRLPRSPSGTGLAGRYFYAHVCLALLPHVLAYHRDRDIPDDVSWATLTALATNLARHRRIHGHGGLDGHQWVVTVFRGMAFRIGRLVFERDFLGSDLAELLPGQRSTTDALGVHIPAAGPLLPEACDSAFLDGARFFRRHFPEETYRIVHCRSWLLDPQLASYLPAESNIILFARRFSLVPDAADSGNGDRAILHWVLETGAPHATAPTTTSLQRAVLQHLREGHHWRVRFGWRVLPDRPPADPQRPDRRTLDDD